MGLTVHIHVTDKDEIIVHDMHVDHSLTAPITYVNIDMGGGTVMLSPAASWVLFDKLSAHMANKKTPAQLVQQKEIDSPAELPA